MSLCYSSDDFIKMGLLKMEHSLFPERWNITLEVLGASFQFFLDVFGYQTLILFIKFYDCRILCFIMSLFFFMHSFSF